jgi:2,4-dienoyl-CoA reductase-like NADH-dependent reductase (Old Yellow Enzyme family)/thioredoxin reductase
MGYPLLCAPGQIGRMTVKNRMVMAPMVRNYADTAGRVTAKYLAHIARLARGGVGAMILEASYVRPDGKGFSHELGLHDAEAVHSLRQLVDIAHEYGVKIGPQLYHAGRQTSSAVTGVQPVAPSALPDPTINEVPRALAVPEIHALADAYVQGARRALEAGCDFVEIHGAHGYLITQFLSVYSNTRTDEYGGSLENRMRFLSEIVEGIREVAGLAFPICVRLSGEEQVPHGLTLEETIEIALRLEALRVDALHISAGNYASYERGYMISPMALPDGPLVPLAAGVKAAVRLPVIAVDKIRTPALAESLLQEGKADFIGLGRPLLADADWPAKVTEDRAQDINLCIACNQGCIGRLFNDEDVWCTVNPATAREAQFDVGSVHVRRRVLVAGGGPAGMEAAKIAAERGHQVTLCEQSDRLGGQLFAAEAAPHRPGWRELREFLTHELARLQVDVRLHAPVTATLARELKAEVAIVATGAEPVRLRVPGAESMPTLAARDLLEGTVEAQGRVVVVGGGCAGAQTAEFLAVRGHQVVICEMAGAVAVDAPRAERELLLARLHELGVEIQTETKVMRVEPGMVLVERPTGEDRIAADTVVVCLGAVPNDALVAALQPVVETVIVVGDAQQPRKVTEAMVEGALAGLAADTAHGMGVWRPAA